MSSHAPRKVKGRLSMRGTAGILALTTCRREDGPDTQLPVHKSLYAASANTMPLGVATGPDPPHAASAYHTAWKARAAAHTATFQPTARSTTPRAARRSVERTARPVDDSVLAPYSTRPRLGAGEYTRPWSRPARLMIQDPPGAAWVAWSHGEYV